MSKKNTLTDLSEFLKQNPQNTSYKKPKSKEDFLKSEPNSLVNVPQISNKNTIDILNNASLTDIAKALHNIAINKRKSFIDLWLTILEEGAKTDPLLKNTNAFKILKSIRKTSFNVVLEGITQLIKNKKKISTLAPMKLLQTSILFTFLILKFNIDAQTEKQLKINFSAQTRSVETLGKKLKNTKAYLYNNNILIDSMFSEKGKIFFNITYRSVYKIVFTKVGYINKHVIINTSELPLKLKYKKKIKADINLFKHDDNIDVSFLVKTPVSIASYSFIKKKILWDFEYNRIIVEKLINAYVHDMLE